jgi:pyruvate kinase
MDIARINMTHSTHEFAHQVIETLREIQKGATRSEVAIWIDVNGPKVRTGKLINGFVSLKKGDEFSFVNEDVIGDEKHVSTTYLKPVVSVGDRMRVDDGVLSFLVTERLENSIKTMVENNGILGENKGINFPLRLSNLI